MRKKLAIFDLDGTVLDTLGDLANSLNYALREYGLPEQTLEQVRLSIGGGLKRMIDRSVPDGVSPAEKEAVYHLFVERYASHFMDETRPYDGIQDLLRDLKNSGMLLALLTNKDARMADPLCSTFFPGMFDLVVGHTPGLRLKPCPDGVESVLNTLSVRAEDAFYIGDSEVDAETSKNAGTETVIVSWGFRTAAELADSGIRDAVPDPQALLSRLLCKAANN
ncbi:MAG: HAD-IA family hydrolase [Clostridia bacterium]|nr:HAD-IA family hydrolase [Clostridia bacterium]